MDREKVIKLIEEEISVCESVNQCYRAIDLPALRDILAVLKEQEPKTGHWIESAGDDKCSVCGATYSDLYPDYDQTHYCPNCGARMTGRGGEVEWVKP